MKKRDHSIRALVAIVLSLAIGTAMGQQRQTKPFVNYESPHVHPIATSPHGNWLAVANTADSHVELFSTAGEVPTLERSVKVGLDPVTVRFRTEKELWVINHVSDSLNVVDVSRGMVTKTVQLGDEPADVVFAGEPQRAYVTCSSENKVIVLDPLDLDDASKRTTLTIAGEDPRSLAVSPDGKKVYVAIFESGNSTTVLAGGIENDAMMSYPPNIVSTTDTPYQGQNPPPQRINTGVVPLENTLKTAPETSLIVRKDDTGAWRDDNGTDWSDFVSGEKAALSGREPGWDVLDHDIAEIDTETHEIEYTKRLMNIAMTMDVNPVSGALFLAGTDATNEIRYEPALKGTFVKVLGAVVDGGATKVFDLNPHLDYEVQTLPPEARKASVGDPRGALWSPDGTRIFVTGMGSDNLAVLDQTGTRLETLIDVGEGPTGLTLSADKKSLYVLNRFGSSVTRIELEDLKVTATVPFFDPTPEEVKHGRQVFYNTHLTSGLGQVSCASCHVDARFDRLAWDLGNPETGVKAMTSMTVLSEALGRENVDMHPMKGPMVTQTLQDIDQKGPFHWRGDMKSIHDFNDAFVNLLGNDKKLPLSSMNAFEIYLGTIHFPPNPYRRSDNSLSEDMPLPGHFTTGAFGDAGLPLPNGNAERGFEEIFSKREHPMLGGATCLTCHSQTTGLGNPLASSEHALTDRSPATQDVFKVVQLRGLYDKIGFTTAQNSSLAGFGFFHDGSVDTLERFLSSDMFALESDQEVADVLAFLLSFSGNDSTPAARKGWNSGAPPTTISASRESHSLTGKQVTFSPSDSSSANLSKIQEITFFSRTDVDVIATMHEQGGIAIPLVWTRSKFENKEEGISLSPPKLAKSGATVTILAVPAGTGVRVLDRDEDGLPNVFESSPLKISHTVLENIGDQRPFHPSVTDSSGDFFSLEPDGIPDGENDFDGDGISNAREVENGWNPMSNWAEIFTPVPPIEPEPNEPDPRIPLPDDEIGIRVSLVSKNVIRVEWNALPEPRIPAPALPESPPLAGYSRSLPKRWKRG